MIKVELFPEKLFLTTPDRRLFTQGAHAALSGYPILTSGDKTQKPSSTTSVLVEFSQRTCSIMRDEQALALVVTFSPTAPTPLEGAASEKRSVSSFLLRPTLYIDVEINFMRLVMPLGICIDVRARTTHPWHRELVAFRAHGHLHPVERNRPTADPQLRH